MQPHSQGLSSSRQKRLKRDAFGGKKRDPGNKAGAVCHSSNLFMNVPSAYCTWKNVVLTSSIFFVLFIVVTICAHPVGGKKCQNFRKIKKCDRCLNVFCCNRFSSTETGCKEIHCILNTKNYFSTSNNKGPHQNCTIEWLQGNC